MKPDPDNKNLLVLLADDDKDDCLLFKEALDELPLSTHLTIVNDGEQLMKFLTKKESHLPDVLFLDLNMPRKNGLECLTEIKLNNKLKDLFIIISSTSSEQEIVNLLYKNGAQYYIRKPAKFSELKKVIHEALTIILESLVVPADTGGEITLNLEQPPREKFVLGGI